MQHGFTFRVTRVFLERIVDDGKIIHILSLFVQQDCLIARLDDVVDMRGFEHCFTVNKHFRALYAGHLAGIFIDKIFRPFFQHTDSQFTPKIFFQICFIHFHLFGQTKRFQNILVALVADGTQQCCNRQFFLAVDVGIHHIIYIRCKFNPRTAERNNARRIQFCTVGMNARTKEHARRTMQLRHNYTLRTIDNKRTFGRHIRDWPQIHILNHGIKILVIRIGAIEFQFRLQRHTISQTATNTLFDGITRRVDIIIEELQHEVIARIRNREILGKYAIQPFVFSLLRWSIKLEEILK